MALQDFQVVARLGSGVYSSVYKARRILDDQYYAIKKVKLAGMSHKEKQNALNEAIILASLHHPNIIGYHETILDSQSQCLCIVMEYAQQGDLLQRITRHKEKKELFQQTFIWKVLISVLSGLRKLHQKRIIHRDIKSANIFITEKESIKIGDLNVSKHTPEGLCFTQTGTPYYASPEIWKDQPYGTKSDIWSLGCVIYQLASLKPPFSGEDMEELYKTVTKGVYPRIPTTYSSDLTDILRMMLQVDPLVRPSADKLLNSSILKKRLKETPTLEDIAIYRDIKDENPQFITSLQLKRKNIRELSYRLPEANYNRSRVKTLHQQGQIQNKLRTSKHYVINTSLCHDYSPCGAKRYIPQIRAKQGSKSGISSKKSQYKILQKRNNVIQMARKEVMNLGSHKLRSIGEKIEKQPLLKRSNEQVYMKRLMRNRTKTDNQALLKNLVMMKATVSDKKVEKLVSE